MATYNDLISRADSGAAIEIPTQKAVEIVQETMAQSAVLNMARVVTIPSKSYTVPVLSQLPDAYWVNGDTGLKQTTKAAWEGKNLTAEPLAVLVPVSDDFAEDSTIDIFAQLKPLLAEAFGRKLDQAALFNVNRPASWSDSVVSNAIAAGNYLEVGKNAPVGQTGESDLAQDLAAMGAQLADDGYNMSGVVTEPGFFWRVAGQRTADGHAIFTPNAGERSQNLYGLNFFEQRNGAWDADTRLIAGDWSKSVVGIRSDITFTVHTDAVISDDAGNVVFNAMQQDSKILRAVMRVGFVIADNVTNQNTTASRSPFSVLTNPGTAAS